MKPLVDPDRNLAGATSGTPTNLCKLQKLPRKMSVIELIATVRQFNKFCQALQE